VILRPAYAGRFTAAANRIAPVPRSRRTSTNGRFTSNGRARGDAIASEEAYDGGGRRGRGRARFVQAQL
jgi:hypothetical protein